MPPEPHRPASHPVLRAKHERLLRMVQAEPTVVRAALDLADNRAFEVTEALEMIARVVAKMPEVPFTVEQRGMGQLIARELHSRSRSQEALHHEAFYAKSRTDEVEQRYSAIAESAASGRRLRDIASEYGVTTQLVSRIAIARGHRRRTRHG